MTSMYPCQTSAFVPALQKIPAGAAKAASEAATKGKGGKQKAATEGKAAKAAVSKRGRRVTSGPAAAGMIGQLSRRLLHMRIMLCELLACRPCERDTGCCF